MVFKDGIGLFGGMKRSASVVSYDLCTGFTCLLYPCCLLKGRSISKLFLRAFPRRAKEQAFVLVEMGVAANTNSLYSV